METKSERLKKLEVELEDLEQWLKLGLVPKKEIDKHKNEIETVKAKIEEERERLRFLKENGELEEYVAPKRAPARHAYPETHTLPDVDMGGEGMTDIGIDMETEGGYDMETTFEDTESDEEAEGTFQEDDEDPFSDRNRWKRGVMEDPDVDNW
jgi:DNA repair exonuclease SbcCD ATPase subunit